MLDDLVSIVIGDVFQRVKNRGYRVCVVGSCLVGVLFFLLTLTRELLFSDKPMITKDIIVLAGLSMLVSVFLAVITCSVFFVLERKKKAPSE